MIVRDGEEEILHVGVTVPLEYYGTEIPRQQQVRIALEEAKPGATKA